MSKKLCQQNTTDHDECINEINIQLNVCSKNIVTAVFMLDVIQCFKVQLFFAVCCKIRLSLHGIVGNSNAYLLLFVLLYEVIL